MSSSNPLLAKLRAKQSGSAPPATSSPVNSAKAGVSKESLTHLPFGARRDAALAAMKRLGQSNSAATASSSNSKTPQDNGTATGNDETFDLDSMRKKFKLGPSKTDK